MNIKIKAALYTLLFVLVIVFVITLIKTYPEIAIKFVLLIWVGIIIYSVYRIILHTLSTKD